MLLYHVYPLLPSLQINLEPAPVHEAPEWVYQSFPMQCCSSIQMLTRESFLGEGCVESIANRFVTSHPNHGLYFL